MAVTILSDSDSWIIPPRSPKESAYRIVRRAADRWAVQATTAERYTEGGDWFAPFASVLTAEEACTALLRRMATQIKDRAYLDAVVQEITRVTGAPAPTQ
ncbi:MAG TPA: hypothetical protein VIG44_04665 [Thermomicrobiales bacterium]|jgi:hypothetical protein